MQYHINPTQLEPDIILEKIELSGTAEDINCRAAHEKVGSMKCLVSNDDTPLTKALDDLKGKPITATDFADVIESPNLDSIVKRVCISVPATGLIAQYLQETGVDLYIRDTRGLLDIDKQDFDKYDGKTLSDLGLECADGVVFFSNVSTPNKLTASIYDDILSTLFKAVPIFVTSQVGTIDVPIRTLSDVNSYMESAQLQGTDAYNNMICAQYQAFEFLNKYGVMKQVFGNEYIFSNRIFDITKARFVVPGYYKLHQQTTNADWETNKELQRIKMFNIAIYENILQQIVDLRQEESELVEYFKEERFWNSWHNDAELTDSWRNIETSKPVSYINPHTLGFSHDRIETDLKEPNKGILGPRDGITTRDVDGTLPYASTILTAVTSYQWINHLIYNTELPMALSVMDGDLQKSNALLQLMLHHIHYKKYIDVNAAPLYFACTNRYLVRDVIKDYRNKPAASDDDALPYIVQLIVNHFTGYVKGLNTEKLNKDLYN